MYIMVVTKLNIKGFQCFSNVVITKVGLCYPTRDAEVITFTTPIKTCFRVLRTDSAVKISFRCEFAHGPSLFTTMSVEYSSKIYQLKPF